MKNLFKRVLSIAAATALLMTSVISAAAADGHSHGGGTKIDSIPKDTPTYTITLSHPDGKTSFDTTSHYGAYQIFSGTVKGEDYTEAKGTENPGTNDIAIPITDIKWGSAFGTSDDEREKNILGFVYALSQAKSGSYSYAFSEFDGFEDFFTKDGALNEAYLKVKEKKLL